ncbi:MAG: hypothetical protein HC781_21700 [Leptolyngbyaceae cyanobacterium CSU_1_4]|nr:hypothetical protein [Leptolyngbyaceae cyanobacterium CSU_1_4]
MKIGTCAGLLEAIAERNIFCPVWIADLEADPPDGQILEELLLASDMENLELVFQLSDDIIKARTIAPLSSKGQNKQAARTVDERLDYWEQRRFRAVLGREKSQKNLVTAQERLVIEEGRGTDIVKHFPIGSVGGSGRNVSSLNKKEQPTWKDF